MSSLEHDWRFDSLDNPKDTECVQTDSHPFEDECIIRIEPEQSYVKLKEKVKQKKIHAEYTTPLEEHVI